MRLDECSLAIKPIVAMFAGSDQEKSEYTDAIQAACGWMDAIRFSATCAEVLATMAQGRRPVPGQYIAAYRRLSESQGWDSASQGAACPECGGIGMVYVSMRRRDDGLVAQWCTPCGRCQPEHPWRHKSPSELARTVAGREWVRS